MRFSCEDSFRSDPSDLLKIYKAVDDMGVDRVGIADTVGVVSGSKPYFQKHIQKHVCLYLCACLTACRCMSEARPLPILVYGAADSLAFAVLAKRSLSDMCIILLAGFATLFC